jgi:hypothetical protein
LRLRRSPMPDRSPSIKSRTRSSGPSGSRRGRSNS